MAPQGLVAVDDGSLEQRVNEGYTQIVSRSTKALARMKCIIDSSALLGVDARST